MARKLIFLDLNIIFDGPKYFIVTLLSFKVLLPPKARGTVTYLAPPGNYTIKDKILETEFDGEKTEYTLMQVKYFHIMIRVCKTKVVQPCIFVYFTIHIDMACTSTKTSNRKTTRQSSFAYRSKNP